MGKYIKKYIPNIIVFMLFVALQAMTNLKLPEYMSTMVDVGISQQGIEYAAPEIIEKTVLDEMFPSDSPIFTYYTYLEDWEKIYSTNYYNIKNKEVYKINTKDDYEKAEDYFIEYFENEGSTDITPESKAISFIIEEYQKLGYDFSKGQNSFLRTNGAKMVGVALISAGFAILAGFINSRLGAGFSRDLREGVFTKVLSLSNTEMEKFSTSSLITRSTNDIRQVQMALSMGLRMMVFAPIMGIGSVIKVVGSERQMARILAVSLFIVLSGIIVFFGMINKKFKIIQKLTDKLNLVIREKLTGMLVIRAFTNEDYMEDKFDDVNQEIADTDKFVVRVMGSLNPLLGLVMDLTIVAIIYYGARYADLGTIKVGDIMAFIQYSTHVIMSFVVISMMSVMIPRAMVSLSRIKEVLDSESSIVESSTPVEFTNKNKGEIEFKDVCFKYPGADGYILKDINFKAKPGETVAFIGTTGSGKSTLVNLIPRLYDATKGEILVDNTNIKDVKLDDLRSRISYAPQQGLLFSGTIESNIKFAGEDLVSDVDMVKSARIAQAEDFILDRPLNFESTITQGGTNVSGGQRQRLSIARAIAKPGDILIFDDSFSALDYKTDAKLRQALNKELSDKTILLVAQRIATIMHADQIIVLDQGEIIGKGKHDELMEDCKIYKELAMSQIG